MELEWHEIQDRLVPHVVRIETPNGTGTGFLFAYNKTKVLAAIATAAHVVVSEDQWRQPIKLLHDHTNTSMFVEHKDRAIFIDRKRDSASIIIQNGTIPFPDQPIKLSDPTKYSKVGVELGWTGYPGIVYPKLCFFSGRISAFTSEDDCYLIDGVAINGVSGGPVVGKVGEDSFQLEGSISSYVSNRQPTGTLPGLLRAHDLTQAHDVVTKLQNFDEAKQKEAQEQKENEEQGETSSSVQTSPKQ